MADNNISIDNNTDSNSNNSNNDDDVVIHVSTILLFVSMIPLLIIALISYNIQLNIEKYIIIGTMRTLIQLTICGYILKPIFYYGTAFKYGYIIVLLYVLFMILLAAYETSRRTKYCYNNMYITILIAFLINVGWVSIFAFYVIIKPKPIYDPHYVIPIIGMLLGNCINGVALSLNHVLSALIEQQSTIELLLSFGANCYEATSNIIRESIRIGSLPIYNSMMVIGLISIPGMMTGQILGGSPVVEAARYQILIMYFIAVCSFGTILTIIYIIQNFIAYDHIKQLIQIHHFYQRNNNNDDNNTLETTSKNIILQIIHPFQDCLYSAYNSIIQCLGKKLNNNNDNQDSYVSSMLLRSQSSSLSLTANNYNNNNNNGYGTALVGEDTGESTTTNSNNNNNIRLFKMRSSSSLQSLEHQQQSKPVLELTNVSCSIVIPDEEETNNNNSSSNNDNNAVTITTTTTKMINLFRNISINVRRGEIVRVQGPSGSGKTRLLRVIAGLSPMDNEDSVNNHSNNNNNTGKDDDDGSKNNDIILDEQSRRLLTNYADFRRRVRYVSQYRVDILGTPRQFINRVAALDSWERGRSRNCNYNNKNRTNNNLRNDNNNNNNIVKIPTKDEMINTVNNLVSTWGLDPNKCLDEEWKHLSGGEAQRVYTAICLASKPLVLLLDESTASLDVISKKLVEQTIVQAATNDGIAIFWVSHDEDQIQRMTYTK